MAEILYKPDMGGEYRKIRLPRKLKKDIIKVAGRDAYYQIIAKLVETWECYGVTIKVRRV